jgi:hypothetical protein
MILRFRCITRRARWRSSNASPAASLGAASQTMPAPHEKFANTHAAVHYPRASHTVKDLGPIGLRPGGADSTTAVVVLAAGVPQRKDPGQQVCSAALLSQGCTIRPPAHVRCQNRFCGGPPTLMANWLTNTLLLAS